MLACLMVAMSATNAAAEPCVVFDHSALPYEMRCTLEALQGLANRSGPRLFLGAPDDRWLSIYGERNGLTCETETDLAALFRRFGKEAKGLAVYDPELDGSRYVAVTLAGVEDLLPVEPALLADDSPLAPLGLPIARDLRGKFADSIAAYDWALAEVMPRCNRRLALAVDGRCDGTLVGLCGPFPGLDWQVQNRGFVFNLAVTAKEMPSYGDSKVGGNAEQAACYERVLEALEPPAQINGYGEPEDTWCKILSEHGHYSFHYGTNWSFHNKVPETRPLKQQRHFTADDTAPETERYVVCFMTSEGDTMKGPLPFFMGSWFDPDRGKVPMSWGLNPIMADLFPAMLSYYYDTATPEDCFYAGCSGAGYAYPDFLVNLEQFARFTGEECRKADIGCVDLWSAAKPDVRRRYAEASGVTALTTNVGRAGFTMAAPGVPVIDQGLMYWQTAAVGPGDPWWKHFRDDGERAKAVDWLVGRIEDIAAHHEPPFVVLVFADVHSYDRHAMVHREVADKLDPKRFRTMRLDEAVAGLKAWTDGRVMVDSGGINEKIVWAALEGLPTQVPVALVSDAREDASIGIQLTGAGDAVDLTVAAPALKRTPVEGLALRLAAGDVTDDAQLTVSGPLGEDVRRPSVTLVPVEPGTVEGAHEARLIGLWDGVGLSHSAGSIFPDASALWGRAWTSPPAEGGKECCLIFGPYVDAPEGRCLVSFRLKLTEAAPDPETIVASLDVNTGGYGGLGVPLGKRDLRARDFAQVGEWQWFATTFDWPGGLNRLETRVTWTARAGLAVDRVAAFGLR